MRLGNLYVTWALAAGLCACGPDSGGRDGGPCTETGVPDALSGFVFDAGGKPASGAEVKLFRLPASDTAGLATPTARAFACRDGSFKFTGLPAAAYAVKAFDSLTGTAAWFPRAALPDSTLPPIKLVLREPARLRGRVTRGSNPPPAGIAADENILVRLLGTDRFYLTDTSGEFLFNNLAEGVYRAAFGAADGHYLSAYRDGIAVHGGVDTVLPRVDLEWSPFVAPPRAAGLQAEQTAGAVRLHWRAAAIANLAHYDLLRRDSTFSRRDDTLAAGDTLYADSAHGLPQGTPLRYAVRAVNRSGEAGPWSAWADAVAPGDTAPQDLPGLGALVLSGTSPADSVVVRLYAAPSAPGSRDSLPLPARLRDSAVTGADGAARFDVLPAGLYSLEAEDPRSGKKALLMGLHPRPDAGRDTLPLEVTCELTGTASRRPLWIANPYAGDAGILVSLAGAPYATVTDSAGRYDLKGVAAGSYREVVYVPPAGLFSPESLNVTLQPGQSLAQPALAPLYNPDQIPPKPAYLRIASSSKTRVALQWRPVTGYPYLAGYEVTRRDSALKVSALSGLVADSVYTDTLAGAVTGMRFYYTVHSRDTQGKASAEVGDLNGSPVEFQVP